MSEDRCSCCVLGAPERFGVHLINELSKFSEIWIPTPSEFPLSDPALIAGFLTVRRPSIALWAPRALKGRPGSERPILEAVARALSLSESILVVLDDSLCRAFNKPQAKRPELLIGDDFFNSHPEAAILHLVLPEVILCRNNPNKVGAFCDRLLSGRMPSLKTQNSYRMISDRLLARCAAKSIRATLANPKLAGPYFLSSNGVANDALLSAFINQKLSEFTSLYVPRVMTRAASFGSAFIEAQKQELFSDTRSFQEQFEFLLPGWQADCQEIIAAHLAAKGLI